MLKKQMQTIKEQMLNKIEVGEVSMFELKPS